MLSDEKDWGTIGGGEEVPASETANGFSRAADVG